VNTVIVAGPGPDPGARPAPPLGQAVGQAEASLTRLLSGVLAEWDTSRETYLALQRLAALGGQASRDAYENDLADWLDLDAQAARALTARLAAAGLAAEQDATIALTGPGRARREGILAATAQVTGPLLAALDRDDVATTIRTLNEITRRARGIPARRTTTEGNS
jgi:DNA-binding MarR family transcriptional regulator